MAQTTYISYEPKKGFWISINYFELISYYITQAFEKKGLDNKPEWFKEIYEEFNEARLGHLRNYMVILFE